MRWIVTILFLLVLSLANLSGQTPTTGDSLFVLPNGTKVFSIENLYTRILENHPVVKQVDLLSEVARQEIRLARGSFDPKVEAEFFSKHYQGKEYYSILNGELKFPTATPLVPALGVDRNKGDYLNPERYVGDQFNYHQLYAGISIPLGQGLMTDERRATLQQAKLFSDLTEAEQVKWINKLLLDAAKDYWQWYFSYYNLKVLSGSLKIAEIVMERTKFHQTFGEAAAVDTVQARITLQEREIQQREAMVNFRNAEILLSTYLWDSVGMPLELDEDVVPVRYGDQVTLSDGELQNLFLMARENHPELKKLRVKVRQLEVENRLAKENLKPKLNLTYYFLNQPWNPEGNVSFTLQDNYKVGVDFSFPIFLRKERSKVALTNLKLSNTKYEQDVTERQILNELKRVHNNLTNFQVLINNQYEMMQNYERLLDAELLNLNQGESDLFKINVQQDKLIQTQGKWLKLIAEFEKEKAYLYWAAGLRPLQGS